MSASVSMYLRYEYDGEFGKALERSFMMELEVTHGAVILARMAEWWPPQPMLIPA